MHCKRPIIIPEIFSKDNVCDFLIQTANVLAKKNYPTYIYYTNQPPVIKNNIQKIAKNLYAYLPYKFLPFNRFKLIYKANLHLSFFLLNIFIFIKYKCRPVFWFFYPQVSSLIKFAPKPAKIIYDIVDFFTSKNKKLEKILVNQKKYLMKKADLITAISETMMINYQRICPTVSIKVVPQGFRLLTSSEELNPKIFELKNLKNKIGFIGSINNRLDFNLLFKVIEKNSKYNFIFIGPYGHDNNVSEKPIEQLAKKLFSYKNVYYVNKIDKNQISQFINLFDIAIIPYDSKDEFNKLCYPMKLFEYFAAGKPVVSTQIDELKKFPELVYMSDADKDWNNFFELIFSNKWPQSKVIASKRFAKENSWKNKVTKILSLT